MQLERMVQIAVVLVVAFIFILGLRASVISTAQEEQEGMLGQLNEVQRFVTIDGRISEGTQASSSVARKEFKGVVAANFLNGQQCVYQDAVYWGEDFAEKSSYGDNYQDKTDVSKLAISSTDGNTLDQLSNNENQVIFPSSQENLVRYGIDNTAYEGRCGGVDMPEDPFTAVKNKIWTSPYMTIVNRWDGYTAQGVYGNVEFEIDQSFRISEPRLMGMRLGKINLGSGYAKLVPNFVRGERMATFVPEGILPEDRQQTDYSNFRESLVEHQKRFEFDEWGESIHTKGGAGGVKAYSQLSDSLQGDTVDSEDGSTAGGGTGLTGDSTIDESVEDAGDLDNTAEESAFHWRRHALASRIRMIGVPTVADGFNLNEFEQLSTVGEQHSYLVRNVDYVLCEGMEGKIQTNAGAPGADGKQYMEDPPRFRDVPYPYVKVENRGEFSKEDIASCLQDAGYDTSQNDLEKRFVSGSRSKHGWLDTTIWFP